MKNEKMTMNFIWKLSVSAALAFFTSCTMYDSFDEDLVTAYIEEHSPQGQNGKPVTGESSSSAELSSSSSEMSSSSEALSSSSEGSSSSVMEECPETFTDERDGFVYDVVEIFDKKSKTNRCWFASNLQYKQEYSTCYSDAKLDSTEACKEFGRLYSGDRLKNKGVSGTCPEGTHILSISDLNHFVSAQKLTDCEISVGSTCDEMAKYMKTSTADKWEEASATYDDPWDLNFLPGGACIDGRCANAYSNGIWWVMDEGFDDGFGEMRLTDINETVTIYDIDKGDLPETSYSIRCVLD